MKRREFWIAKHELDDFILYNEPYGTHSSKFIHVREILPGDDAREVAIKGRTKNE